MADTSNTDSQSDDTDIQDDVKQRQRELDAILATKLSWSRSGHVHNVANEAPASQDPVSQAPNDEDDLATTAFPLFGTNNHVRLLSPSLIYTGPGKGRILEEAEESKSVRKERKKRIAGCAVDANWIFERSDPQYWTPHPHDARKLETRTFVPRLPLPKAVMGFLKLSSVPDRAAPLPKAVMGFLKLSSVPDRAAPSSASTSTSTPSTLPRTPKESQRVKLRPYPDAQKVRLAKKVTKERFVMARKPKRKSKKRRGFEKAGKGKELPGLSVKSKG